MVGIKFIKKFFVCLFVWVEALCPSQQFSVMSGCFPGLNQY